MNTGKRFWKDTHQTAHHSYLHGDTGTRNEYPRASNPTRNDFILYEENPVEHASCNENLILKAIATVVHYESLEGRRGAMLSTVGR